MSIRKQELADRVEFRWRQHEEDFARLLAEGARKAGRPSSDHARELLKEALTASDHLQQAVEEVNREVVQQVRMKQ